MAKFFFILISLAFISVKAQIVPSYYNRPLDYGQPSSVYNSNPSPYASNAGYGPSLSYQQEQEMQRQQALNAYQQQASVAASPSNLPTQPAQPTESYAPIPRDPSNIYGQNPSLSYRPQSLPAINYQPNSQPALPASTYDSQPQDNSYLAAQQAAAQQAAAQQAAEQQAAQQAAAQQAAQQAAAQQAAAQQAAAQQAAAQQAAAQQAAAQQAAAQQAAARQAAAQQAARENAARQAAVREAELARYAEAMRQAEAARQIEANKQADAARQAEASRLAESKRQAEINRQAALIAQQQREAAIAIQRQREAAIAIQNQRDAAAAQQRYNQQAVNSNSNSNSAPAPSYNYNQLKQSLPTTTEAPKVIHRPAAIHYASIGQELNGDYTFGYHTGQGDKDNSFREEQRLPDGTVKGAYGYVDASGKKHIIKYTAGKDGFKVEGDVNPDIAAASQAKMPALEENTTPAPYQAPYQPSPPPSYQSAPAPTQSYQPEPTRNYQASALRSSVAPQNSIPYQAPSSEVASTYQAPIQRQSYNLPASRPYQPLSAQAPTQLVAAAASAYPTSSRLSSKAVRKLMQSKYNQPLVNSGIDTSASAAVSSSVAPEQIKIKNNLPVQILRQPPPSVPNYSPINVRRARSQNRTPQNKAAYNTGIETSASSSKISIEPLRRSDDENTQKVSSPINFPALAMQSFLSRIK